MQPFDRRVVDGANALSLVFGPTPHALEGCRHVPIQAHPSRRRPVALPHRLSVEAAGVLGRLSVLLEPGILRGHRPHRGARHHGHAVLRRFRRHAGGLRRQSSRRRALRHQMAAPRHDADDPLHVARRRGRGLRHHHVDHLSPPVSHRARLQRARSRHPGPHRLERSDLALEERGGELRLQKNDRARRALRARAGAPAGLPPFVGQHRTGRHQARPRKRNFRRSRQSASPQFRGRVLQRARPPARVAVTAAASGHHSGRTIRTGHGSRRALRRPAVFHAADAAKHEGASRRTRHAARQIRPQAAKTAASYGRCASRSPVRRPRRRQWRSTTSILSRRKPA